MANFMLKELTAIAQTICDKKGFNILVLDVRNVSSMTDYFILAEGNVDRHVRAIGLSIIEALSPYGYKPLHVEGQQTGDWVVLDYGSFVIHLFIPDFRERYRLEEVWKEGTVVDIAIEMPPVQSSNQMS